MIVNNVIGLAKTARVFGVPTILTTIVEERRLLIKGHDRLRRFDQGGAARNDPSVLRSARAP
jgi:hypothetical protein